MPIPSCSVESPLALVCLDLDETLVHIECEAPMVEYIQRNPKEFERLDVSIVEVEGFSPFAIFYREHLSQFLSSLLAFKVNP